MGQRNPTDTNEPYFLTMTVVNWIDVFTRPIYRYTIVEALNHCIEQKGLIVYGWCLMSNHLHLIAAAKEGCKLSDIIRDFKKFTSKKIIQAIEKENESRREWMLNQFKFAGNYDPKITNYRFWQPGNEAKELTTSAMLLQKLDYTHNNPVKAEYVAEPHHYLYSSARDYAGIKGWVNIVFV